MVEISQDDVDRAAAAGAIDPSSAAALRTFVERRQAGPIVDEEQFRLVSSFNDIFVAMAAGIALFAVGALGTVAAPAVGGFAVAASAWYLATIFTARRRMALPSIVLALAFLGGVAGATGGGVLGVLPAAALHWWRFRVPIVPAAAFLAACMLVMAFTKSFSPWLVLPLGLAGFAWALHFDRSDLERRTRRSDTAFWLHLVSAGLIVHPLFSDGSLMGGVAEPVRPLLILLVYAVLTLVALAIDRRALLVAALLYFILAVGTLVSHLGTSWSYTIPVTAFVIGAVLLLLSAFWSRARSALVRRLPSAWQRRVPPTLSPRPA